MTNHQDRRRLNSAVYVPCSLVQLARVVVCVRVLVDVLCVMIVVLIGRHTVGAIFVAIFVVIFCNWRYTLYSFLGKRSIRTLRELGAWYTRPQVANQRYAYAARKMPDVSQYDLFFLTLRSQDRPEGEGDSSDSKTSSSTVDTA